MHLEFTLLLVGAALAASALGGLLGMAGGIFIVPMLTQLWHIDVHTAVGTGLVSVIACSCATAPPFLRAGLSNIRLAVILEVATTLGALGGVLVAGIVPEAFLLILFAVVLLVSARQMLVKRVERPDGVATDTANPFAMRRLSLGMVLMFGAGLISALLGIGSGVLKIPAMDGALRLPLKISAATSNFMIGVTCAASAGAYYLRGDIVPAIAGPVALGSVVGAVLGARMLVRTSNDKIRVLFAVILVALAAQMTHAAL